jgi:phage terminase large subunit-like protein
MPKEMQATFLGNLSNKEKERLWYKWEFWAREKQLPPDDDWRTWLILAGRGFGKTRTGAETVRGWVESKRCTRLALVARTAADVRDVVVEGPSGILACSPPWYRPVWNASKRRLTWPDGQVATVYTADEPDLLRGPEHDGAWTDELASWRYREAWDNLMFGLRRGKDPRVVVTTTPRPTPLIRELVQRKTTRLTRGTTYENKTNLAPAFLDEIVTRYEGTRLGRQELNAEILDDNPNALWKRAMLDDKRVSKRPEHLRRVVVAVDPPVAEVDLTAEDDKRAECGIVVASVGLDGHGYVLDDCSMHGSPAEWGKKAVWAYKHYEADRLVAEINQGGAMVQHVIRTVDSRVSYKGVHASRGKLTRAEPVAALYEQGRVHHLGCLALLEDQMCTWMPGDKSPDRMDALVWAITDLMLTGRDRRARAW